MNRDNKGRFSKSSDDGLKITLGVPSVKKIILYLLLAIILMPWISILSKLNILRKIVDYFEYLLKLGNEDTDSNGKKMDYFIR